MMHSPLRYPGGKSDFLLLAKEIFEAGGFAGRPIVEPYAGSAAVSLGLLDLGLTPSITLLERDPLLYGLWHCVFNCPEDLIVAFQELPITLKTWNDFQPLLKVEAPSASNLLQLGLACLFFNRANFSGILNAGPIGGKGQKSDYKIDCRTNKDEIISRLLALAMFAGQVVVKFGDAVDLLKEMSKRKDVFFYLDPPYFTKGDLLYRYHYGLQDHKRLAECLHEVKSPWLLSYDEHYIIEYLYEAHNVAKVAFQYSARSAKQHTELLISNFVPPLSDLHLRHPVRRQRSPSPSLPASLGAA